MEYISRKIILIFIIFSLLLSGCQISESAKKDYPVKQIKLVVSYAPGGVTDTLARIVTEEANKHLPNDQIMVIENKAGAAGILGVSEVLRSKNDGYRIGITGLSPVSILPHFGQTNYGLEDFTLISRLTSTPLVLAVKADSEFKTYEDWLAFVEENPGEFRYGTQGTGGISHLAMESISKSAEVQTTQIPFEGSTPALTALLGGQIEGAVVQDSEVTAYTESGDLRVIFATSPSTIFPNSVVLQEKGIDFETETWLGVFGPKDLPLEIQDIISNAFRKGLAEEKTIDMLKKQGMNAKYADADEFKQVAESDYEKFGEIIKETGLGE
ncbi:tripartite tricarboxylate transporter substrate binding protein [Cytobacillus sp. FSL R5-0569]|uniref:Bug family tripartite tricarboxylate transporter substrate binding protein n=1 Tax=Cytobacillus sp. FSL R5-0569 TaxID=2921649 RepID=UPI0030F5F11A